MAYSVRFRPAAERDLKRLAAAVLERIDSHVLALAQNPRPSGVKKLAGKENLWRVRVGDYRIIYQIEDGEQLVTVTRVLHRSKAYQ